MTQNNVICFYNEPKIEINTFFYHHYEKTVSHVSSLGLIRLKRIKNKKFSPHARHYKLSPGQSRKVFNYRNVSHNQYIPKLRKIAKALSAEKKMLFIIEKDLNFKKNKRINLIKRHLFLLEFFLLCLKLSEAKKKAKRRYRLRRYLRLFRKLRIKRLRKKRMMSYFFKLENIKIIRPVKSANHSYFLPIEKTPTCGARFFLYK